MMIAMMTPPFVPPPPLDSSVSAESVGVGDAVDCATEPEVGESETGEFVPTLGEPVPPLTGVDEGAKMKVGTLVGCGLGADDGVAPTNVGATVPEFNPVGF
mmetsp:Transcript_97450/g.135455  ORF Transcript_97450/g.135455 Transcript_97450/m.135455 type:complete len:101 (-) Transcript_97450:45-347(-)